MFLKTRFSQFMQVMQGFRWWALSLGAVSILFVIWAWIDRGGTETASHTRRLRLGHDSEINSAVHEGAVEFAKNVALASGGKLQIDIYPKQELGTDHAMIEMARVGEIDFVVAPTSKITSVSPAMQILDLPFFFEDAASIYKVLDGRLGRALKDSIADKGLVGISFWEAGWKHFTTNFPMKMPSDFKGHRFRVMRSPMIIAQFEALGARAVPIDFAETYNALKDKQVDGEENPISSIYDMRFHEVQSHLILSHHGFLSLLLVASSKTLEGLSPDLRQILTREGEAIVAKQRAMSVAKEASALDLIKKSPIEISELTDDARREFQKSTMDLMHMFADDIGHDVIKMTFEDLGMTMPNDNAIVVVVDADLSGKSAISGQAILRGASLAAKHVNDAGGVSGRKIRVVGMDHQAVAARSANNLEKVYARDNVRAVLGGLQSAIIMGEMPKIGELAQKDKVYISSWATAEALVHNDLKPNPVFRLSAHDKLSGPFLVREAIKKSKKVALLLENSVWGRGNQDQMTAALRTYGVKPRIVEFFNVEEKEFVSHLKKIEDSGAEIILMVANPAEAKEIVKTSVSRPKKLPFVAHWGLTGGSFGKDLKSELQSVDLRFLQTVSFVGNKRPQAQRVAADYLSIYGGGSVEDIEAAAGVARSYDAMRILAIALQMTEKNPKLKLLKAMEDVAGYEGVLTSYKYPFKGQREAIDVTSYRLGRYDEQGRIVPVGKFK
jgi:tripartite ATP-independent transporter DctP family solute receptor